MRADDVESAIAVRDEVIVVELKDLSGALIGLLKGMYKISVRRNVIRSKNWSVAQSPKRQCDSI